MIPAGFHESTELTYKLLCHESDSYVLVYRIMNQTSSEWYTIRLRFDLGGLCAGSPKQWSIPVTVSPSRL